MAKEAFYEKGLVGNAKDEALDVMERKVSDAYNTGYKSYKASGQDDLANKLQKSREQFMEQAKTSDIDASAKLRGVAAGRATIKNPLGVSNSDLAYEQYSKAVKATNLRANVRTAGNMAKNYYYKPFTDGRIGVGAARAGATIGGASAITYSLTGGPNTNDYAANYSSSGDGDTIDY